MENKFELNILANRKIPWTSNGSIVISSRIRLARNLSDIPFPSRAEKKTQLKVFDSLIDVISDMPEFTGCHVLRLNDCSKIDRLLLMERHLISHEILSKTSGVPGIVFTSDEKIAIMINEEDHFRIQMLTPEISLASSWDLLSRIEESLNDRLKFAFNSKYGYLTSCITNTGNGLRVSCLMHLPGLVMTNNISRLMENLINFNISVRGFYGEGTKPIGDIFQISNSVTLNKPEAEIIDNFEKIIHTVVKYEQEAKSKMHQDNTMYKLEDKVLRAYGILSYAKTIDSEEAILHLSKLRLASELNIRIPINKNEIDQLIFLIQPGHLQEISNKELEPAERDIARAELIRRRLLN